MVWFRLAWLRIGSIPMEPKTIQRIRPWCLPIAFLIQDAVPFRAPILGKAFAKLQRDHVDPDFIDFLKSTTKKITENMENFSPNCLVGSGRQGDRENEILRCRTVLRVDKQPVITAFQL